MAISPITFKRGSTLSLMFRIPERFDAGFFKDWFITAQLRKEKNDSPNGLIADIGCFWGDPTTATRVVLNHQLTDKWPLGNAELDILFTSVDGTRVRTNTIPVVIQRGITR